MTPEQETAERVLLRKWRDEAGYTEGFPAGAPAAWMARATLALSELAERDREIERLRAEVDRLRTALTESGKEQVFIDGYTAAVEDAESVKILAHGQPVRVWGDNIVATLRQNLARLNKCDALNPPSQQEKP